MKKDFIIIIGILCLVVTGCTDSLEKELNPATAQARASISWVNDSWHQMPDDNVVKEFSFNTESRTEEEIWDGALEIEMYFNISLYNKGYRFSYIEYMLYNADAGVQQSYKVFVRDDEDKRFKGQDYERKWSDAHHTVIYRPGKYSITAGVVLVDSIGGIYKVQSRDLIEIDLDYPDWENMIDDGIISYEMKSAWDETLENNYEYGFPIYIKNDDYIVGSRQTGEMFSCPDMEEVITKTEIEYSENAVNPTQEGGTYLVALFHTHPWLTDCDTTVYRIIGPSSFDEESFEEWDIQVPGLVYDYSGLGETLHGGHKKDLSTEIYNFGIDKRDYESDPYDRDGYEGDYNGSLTLDF